MLLATSYADLPRISKPYHQAQLQAEINKLLAHKVSDSRRVSFAGIVGIDRSSTRGRLILMSPKHPGFAYRLTLCDQAYVARTSV